MRILLTGILTLVFTSNAIEAQKPNIVLVIADDMAWNDCGPYGSKSVHTPNIDKLAKSGMTFQRAFTATAMCSPTRQQLYTGVFPVRNGAYPNHSQVKPGTKSLVHHLRNLGYRVGLNGKRHIGPKASFPFEKGDEEFVTRDKKQPFCLVVASKHPHAPWNAGPRNYDPKKLVVPKYLADNPETRKSLAAYYSEVTAFDSEVGHWMKLIDKAKVTENTIFIVTSEQGPQFPGGKWTCYDYGLRVAFIVRWPGKVAASSRVHAMIQYVDVLPTLIEAAGGKPEKINTGRPGATEGGNGFDGKSFLRVLQGKTDQHNKYVFGVHTTNGIIAGKPYPVRSIRSEKFKYVRNLLPSATFQNIVTEKDRQGHWAAWKRDSAKDPHVAKLVRKYQHRPAEELYDIVNDPFEMHNLADNPTNRKTINELKARLSAWMKQQGDKGIETEMTSRRKRKKKQKP
jgi:N-sulfoglucosamine sulfohydrolase